MPTTAGQHGWAEVVQLPGKCHISTAGITASPPWSKREMARADESDYLDGRMQAWGPTPSQKPQNTYFCSLEFKTVVPCSITAGFGKKSIFLINTFL